MRHLLLKIAQRRAPDFVIGGREDPYLLRWWLIPRNPVFNVYLHCFLRSDDDRALHTHPWLFNVSWLLGGRYIEWVPSRGDNSQHPECLFRKQGQVKFRWGGSPHRVQLYRSAGQNMPCWTLFITGPRVRKWGFLCPQGFIHWKLFTAPTDKGAVGKGCDA